MHKRHFLELHPAAKEAFIKAKNSCDWKSIVAKDTTHYRWLGECGHISTTYASKWIRNGCRVCMNQELLTGFNDLKTKMPAASENWDSEKNGVSSSNVRFNSPGKYYWKCNAGHSWCSKINSIYVKYPNKAVPCLYCDLGRFLPGFNDIQTKRPDLALLWDEHKNQAAASEIFINSTSTFHWRCSKGHYWENTASNMNNASFPCQYCSDWLVWTGDNDLATFRPDLVEEWDFSINSMNPNQYLFKSNTLVSWVCKLGHKWEDTISHRINNRGCPYCSSRRVLSGFNDLQTLNPILASEWHPTKNPSDSPSTVTAYSNQKFWWLCSEGHEWEQTVGNRNTGRDCKVCSKKHGPSKVEKAFIKRLKSEVSYEIIANSRKIIEPYELDVFIPSLSIGIEFNGAYWHDEVKRPVARLKHDLKEKLCKEGNIRLIIVWEDDWYSDSDKVIEDVKFMIETEESVLGYDYACRRILN